MDRSATCLFGIRNYGVDINGYVRHPTLGLCIWLQQRSDTKQTWPGKWDNMVLIHAVHIIIVYFNWWFFTVFLSPGWRWSIRRLWHRRDSNQRGRRRGIHSKRFSQKYCVRRLCIVPIWKFTWNIPKHRIRIRFRITGRLWTNERRRRSSSIPIATGQRLLREIICTRF